MSGGGRSTFGSVRSAFLLLLTLLVGSWTVTPRPAGASFVVHRPLHEIFAEADLVALVVRRSPVPDMKEDPSAREEHDVVFEVRHVVKATRGEKEGDPITLRTYREYDCMCPGNELGQASNTRPFATYLTFLTWDEKQQAYRPGAFSPRVRAEPPAIVHPDSRGNTWLSVEDSSWGFCPPVTLPTTNTQDDGTLQCPNFKTPYTAWFTLEDLERQAWSALTPADYPIEHVRRCDPPYVLPTEPLGRVAFDTSKPLNLWKGHFRTCWQTQLARDPKTTSGRYVERIVLRDGEIHFPFGPQETVSPELTRCMHEALTWISLDDEGPGEVEVRLELTSEPRVGVDPNPHFR